GRCAAGRALESTPGRRDPAAVAPAPLGREPAGTSAGDPYRTLECVRLHAHPSAPGPGRRPMSATITIRSTPRTARSAMIIEDPLWGRLCGRGRDERAAGMAGGGVASGDARGGRWR